MDIRATKHRGTKERSRLANFMHVNVAAVCPITMLRSAVGSRLAFRLPESCHKQHSWPAPRYLADMLKP
jgi:hypothetical protein